MRFLYLMQAERRPSEDLLQILGLRGRPLVVLAWDEDGEDEHSVDRTILHRRCPWHVGRNILRDHVVDRDYDYFVFIEDDARWLRGSLDEFECLLEEHEPAIGFPVQQWITQDVMHLKKGVGAAYIFDAILNAFHKTAFRSPFLFPLDGYGFEESYYYASHIMMHKANLLYFPDYINVFLALEIANARRGDYGNRATNWPLPENHLFEQLKITFGDRIVMTNQGPGNTGTFSVARMYLDPPMKFARGDYAPRLQGPDALTR